jgi:hypothetical protein
MHEQRVCVGLIELYKFSSLMKDKFHVFGKKVPRREYFPGRNELRQNVKHLLLGIYSDRLVLLG